MNTPIPGKDAVYICYCPRCDDGELHATRGGMKAVEHCYGCGHEKPVRGFSQKDIEGLVLSSWSHWRNYLPLPYNWHEMDEATKMKLLARRKKK